jgi:hypothetical protein
MIASLCTSSQAYVHTLRFRHPTLLFRRLTATWHGQSGRCFKCCFLALSASAFRRASNSSLSTFHISLHPPKSQCHNKLHRNAKQPKLIHPSIRSLILRLRVTEPLPRRRELAQLVADHVLRYRELMVDLAIVNLKFEADEVGEDSSGARVCFDGWSGCLPRPWANYWKSVGSMLGFMAHRLQVKERETHGKIFGPK